MPYTTVKTAPDEGGSSFVVEDWDGWAFGTATGPTDDNPLRVLVWSGQHPLLDNPKDWADIEVVSITDDTFHYGAEADIEIVAGMRVTVVADDVEI